MPHHPETIQEELISRLGLEPKDFANLAFYIPFYRDKLSEPERLHLFTRMALTLLRSSK